MLTAQQLERVRTGLHLPKQRGLPHLCHARARGAEEDRGGPRPQAGMTSRPPQPPESPGRLRRVQCLWAPQEKIFQYVVALDRGQWLAADLAVQRLMRHATFGLDPNDLIVRLTMRAGKILSAIVGHHNARLPRPLIPLHSYAPMTGPSRSSNAARDSRARCTRLRSVPIGQSQARAAS